MARITKRTAGVVLSHKGVPVNMAAMVSANSKMRAAGNAHMNARGDILDSKGNVIKTREQIASEYYSKNPKAVERAVDLSKSTEEMLTGKKTKAKVEDPVRFADKVAAKNDIASLSKFELGAVHEEAGNNESSSEKTEQK